MVRSHNINLNDFSTSWYEKWSKDLKQTPSGKGNYALHANKFWQNAVMAQILDEHGKLATGSQGIGFGVGEERLPALFASKRVHIMATDQDFTAEKAKKWKNNQLATGLYSLNKEGLCSPKLFEQYVRFAPVDMNDISDDYASKYDFLWSNCALGHLGSLTTGLSFIKESLKCLKPGGLAVHTTELNLLSNDATAESGPTVVFRLRDLYSLFIELAQLGYICSPFIFNFDHTASTQSVVFRPEWGTDATQLLVNGHISTQVVIFIKHPLKPLSPAKKQLEKLAHLRSYRSNLRRFKRARVKSPTLCALNTARQIKLEQLTLSPVQSTLKSKPGNNEVFIEYRNNSNSALMGIHRLFDTKPIVLSTDQPVNRPSKLKTKDWSSPNRPCLDLYHKGKKGWQLADYILPGELFALKLPLAVSHDKNKHSEAFCLVQEGGGPIPNTSVTLS